MISAKFLILDVDLLATSFQILFNYAFKFGVFPDCFITANVISIFKLGDKTEIGNYCPISILSTFSKILEKLIYNKTQSFLGSIYTGDFLAARFEDFLCVKISLAEWLPTRG